MLLNILFIVGFVYLSLLATVIRILTPDKRWSDIADFEAKLMQDEMLSHKVGSPDYQIAEVYMADAEEASRCEHPMSIRLRIVLTLIGVALITPRVMGWLF